MSEKLCLAAIGIAIVTSSAGCGPKSPCENPDEVVIAFHRSLMFGDTAVAYEMLSGSDRRALKQRAENASAKAGRKIEPHEMLVPQLVVPVGDLSAAAIAPVAVEVGDVKEVSVTFPGGRKVSMPVVREAGCYRIPLGLEE